MLNILKTKHLRNKVNYCPYYNLNKTCAPINKIFSIKYLYFCSQDQILDDKSKKNLYKLNIPNTDFNDRVSSHEYEIKNIIRMSQDFYREQIRDKNRKLWVTHECPSLPDGPPHLGILYNRIQKDSINRLKIMQGYKVHYNLGFECFGLRIEDKVANMKNVS